MLEIALSAGVVGFSLLTAYLGWKDVDSRKKLNQLSHKYKELQNHLSAEKLENRGLEKTITSHIDVVQTYETKLGLYSGIIDKEAHLRELDEQIQDKKKEIDEAYATVLTIKKQIKALEKELKPLEETSFLESFAFYERQYDFPSASRYQSELERVYQKQKEMIRSETAAVCDQSWVVGGSEKEGQKLVKSFIKTMLRAFNGECDASISKAKYNNVQTMISRINASYEFLNKAGQTFYCRITKEYFNLKIEELQLSYEYQVQKQEELEEQRLIREQMREEERAQKELDKAKTEADKEEKRYQKALEDAKRELESASDKNRQVLLDEIEKLNQRLAEAQTNKERAQSMAQLTRSGYVYIISNIGSFGDNVFKIGMTRRLDPLDRVNELGDASVPFPFDVHAMVQTNDAPALENLLHKKFNHRRLNAVNERKEFFNVSIEEIQTELDKNTQGNPEVKYKIHFTKVAEAAQYRQSLAKKS